MRGQPPHQAPADKTAAPERLFTQRTFFADLNVISGVAVQDGSFGTGTAVIYIRILEKSMELRGIVRYIYVYLALDHQKTSSFSTPVWNGYIICFCDKLGIAYGSYLGKPKIVPPVFCCRKQGGHFLAVSDIPSCSALMKCSNCRLNRDRKHHTDGTAQTAEDFDDDGIIAHNLQHWHIVGVHCHQHTCSRAGIG